MDRLISGDMTTHNVDPQSELGRWMTEQATRIRVHDEPYDGPWLCGKCPYMNSGPICTKCGAPAYEGALLDAR